MALHLFLLVVCLILSLALLWRLCWLHLQPSHSQGEAIHSTTQLLLKPRTPLDCPTCRLSCTHLSVVGPTPAPVRPWREVKSRRGAPKRIDTEGFACPNQQCPYFGVTDAYIHALVGDGKHGHAERIQTFRCQACRTTFSARRHTPLYRLKTPSHQVAMVLAALAEGLDPSAAERVFGYRHATSPPGCLELASTLRCCTRTISATSSSRTCSWMNCEQGYAAVHRYSGCGWLSTPAQSFCPCFIWAPARKTQRIGSSTPCENSWLLVASHSLRVTGSISTSMLSRPILDTGARWIIESGKHASGKWRKD